MIELHADRSIVIGVVADTHVPDRVNALHPDLLQELATREVDYIFHAGDCSAPRVLNALRTIAPVYAVAGNRDWFLPTLPRHRLFHINGVDLLLTHGQVNAWHYWIDKAKNFLDGYEFERYTKRLPPLAPAASVIIYGHSHHAENRLIGGKLFFNPGSSSVAEKPDFQQSFGIIYIHPDGEFSGEIIALQGAMVRFGRWYSGDRFKNRIK
jgi:hypothetical protein